MVIERDVGDTEDSAVSADVADSCITTVLAPLLSLFVAFGLSGLLQCGTSLKDPDTHRNALRPK